MNNFHDQYKKKPVGFTSTTTGRLVRAGKQEERRKANRAENFARHRDVPEMLHQQAISSQTMSDPATRLRRWKIERELQKKIEQQNKKPIFKVGVVHHRFYSPTANDRINNKSVPCHTRGVEKVKNHPTPPKRITRATQKRLEAKKAGNTATTAGPSSSNPSVGRSKPQRRRLPSPRNDGGRSFAPENHLFKAPIGIKGLPLFGRFGISRASQSSSPEIEKIIPEMNKNYEDQPWPTSQALSNKIISPQNMRNPLSRQIAFDSSQDGIVSEPLSDENSECINSNEVPISKVLKVDKMESVEIINLNTPPPRSGSPAPAAFSPYITMSRGKDSARKERRSKMGMSRTSPEEIPTKETVMQNLNISVEDEERTAQYFKFILQREIDRLSQLCDKWEAIKNEPDLTEDAQYLINQAIGQTNLLIRKKFERFRGLVLDCETGKGEMLVQCKDLQGFWDMVYMEVKDCESRFLKLEVLQSRNWIEEEIDGASKKKLTKKKITTKPKIQAKSSVRSWILEKKKKMSQDDDSSDDVVIIMENHDERKSLTSGKTETSKEQTSRRSSRKSPQNEGNARTTPKQTPRKTPASLLKKVQLSEASKNIRSPLAVMKISKMCKTPEVRLDDTISYVNSDQTPGKGILKKSEDSTSSSDSILVKSSRKVDFNDTVVSTEVPIDEDLQNSIDLGRALAHIDSYDSDSSDNVFYEPKDDLRNVTVRRIEKRLDFEDESFIETENTDTAELAAAAAVPEIPAMPIISITMPTPFKTEDESKCTTRSVGKSSRKTSNFVEQSEEINIEEEIPAQSSPRVLRNRTVAPTTPRRSRRSAKTSPIDKSSLNLSKKENNDPQRKKKKIAELEISQVVSADCENDDLNKRRRSTRKSVRFNAEDCSACTDSGKPLHSVTQHARRTQKISLLGENSRNSATPLANGDLMSFDSPTAVPERIRRASQVTRTSHQ